MPQIVRVMDAIRQDNLFPFDLGVGNLAQEMMDAVQAGFLLVYRLDDPPGSLRNVSTLEHDFLGLGVLLPAAPGFHVHGTQLPLFQGVTDAHQEAHVLLIIGNRKPVLDQDDA